MAFNIGDLELFLRLRDELSPSLKIASANLDRMGNTFEKGARGMAPFSAAIAVVGLGAAKAAIDFESSFAGVNKTVDNVTDKGGKLTAFGKDLQDSFRAMAKEIPASVNEINRVAEAGGQLGVLPGNIKAFTRTMIDMGEATNMSSTAAAEGLAQIANVMRNEAGPQYDRLGATVVDLGNKSAATESQIVEFGLRLSGAGKVAGMTEAEVLSIGTALASVGINAEAGGSAFSKVIISMSGAAQKGGKELQIMSDVASRTGKVVGDFGQMIKDDSAGALTLFVEGLGDITKTGGDTFTVLESLGMTEIRMRDALLRLSGAGDLLRTTNENGNKAWEKNNALTIEAEKRYATTASQIEIAKNKIYDIGITIGSALLPAIIGILEGFGKLIPYIESAAKWFTELPKPIQMVVFGIGALVALAAPTLWFLGQMAFSLSALTGLFPTAAAGATKAAVATTGLGGAAGAASITLKGLAIAAGTVLLALAAFAAGFKFGEWIASETAIGRAAVDALSKAFIELGYGTKFLAEQAKGIGSAVGTGSHEGLVFMSNWTAEQRAAFAESVKLKKATDELNASQGAMAKTTQAAAPAQAAYTASSVAAAIAAKTHADEIEKAKGILGLDEKATLSLADAQKVLAASTRVEEAKAQREEFARLVVEYQKANTESGRMKTAQDAVKVAVAAVGPVSKMTMEALRALTTQLKGMGEEGAKVAASLSKEWEQANGVVILTARNMGGDMKPAFDMMAGGAKTAEQAARELREEISKGAIEDQNKLTRGQELSKMLKMNQIDLDQYKKLIGETGEKTKKTTQESIDWAKSLDVLKSAFQTLGVSADNFLMKAVVGFQAAKANAAEMNKVLNDPEATKGQKNMAIGMGAINTAMVAYKSGALGGAAAGASFGASLGAIIPGGALVGGLLGGLAGGFLGLFGGAKKAREETEKLRAEFIANSGGMEALKESAAKAGVSLDALFDAKKPEALKVAIAAVKGELDTWNEAHAKLQEAIDYYGLTVDQLGPKFRDQQLAETALGIYERWDLLKRSGADMVAVLEKMAPETNSWLASTIKAGTGIELAMKPVLMDLAKQGLLLKESGEAYTEAEVEGLSYTKTMSEMFTELISKLDVWLSKLLGIPANISTNVNTNYTQSGDPYAGYGDGGGGGKNQDPGQAVGFWNPELSKDMAFVAHKGEGVSITRASSTSGQGRQAPSGGPVDLSRATLDALTRALTASLQKALA